MKLLLDCAMVVAALVLWAAADELNDPQQVLDCIERTGRSSG